MKKVLLVGSSFSAAPIFWALKRQGLHVTVCGGLESDPCHQYADDSLFIDYSKKELLLKSLIGSDFNYIVPTCNDYSYLSASWVANQLGYPGFDTTEVTEIIHNKKKFRKKTTEFNLIAPRLINEFDFIDSNVPLPYLVKPVDSFSGRGVSKIQSVQDIPQAVIDARAASRSGQVLIEEFVTGSLHSHSAFISNGNIVIDFFVDEFCTVYPYQVNCSNHPSIINEKIRLDLRKEIEKLSRELKIADGLLHTQFMSDGKNFWIIECMRRCPGDLYGTLIKRSTGIDYVDLFILPFLNKEYPKNIDKFIDKFFGRYTVSSKKEQVNFSFSSKFSSEKIEFIPLKSSGEKMNPAPLDKAAILLIEFSDKSSMFEIVPNLHDYVIVNTL